VYTGHYASNQSILKAEALSDVKISHSRCFNSRPVDPEVSDVLSTIHALCATPLSFACDGCVHVTWSFYQYSVSIHIIWDESHCNEWSECAPAWLAGWLVGWPVLLRFQNHVWRRHHNNTTFHSFVNRKPAILTYTRAGRFRLFILLSCRRLTESRSETNAELVCISSPLRHCNVTMAWFLCCRLQVLSVKL